MQTRGTPEAAEAPPADPHDVAMRHQGGGDKLVYYMSGTHTVTARRGKKIDDERLRSMCIARLVEWAAPILSAGEGVWIAMGSKTWSISRERGQPKGHHFGQSCTGVLACSKAEAEALLKAVYVLFDSGDSRFYINHQIHHVGEDRPIDVAMGYTIKDRQSRAYLNRNNFGDGEDYAIEAAVGLRGPPRRGPRHRAAG